MKLQRKPVIQPMWNEPDNAPEARVRHLDELVDMRAHAKRLEHCELPAGFRLVTPTPKQAWVDHQMVWVFVLGWAPVDLQGNRWCEDKYLSVCRYHQAIPDEIQMGWAIQDFQRELECAEVVKPQKRAA